MPNHSDRIGEDFAPGDRFKVEREIELPDGLHIDKAWLTVKDDVGDADPGVFQKTVPDNPADGSIVRDGTGVDDVALIRFIVTSADSDAAGQDARHFSVKVKLSDNSVVTAFSGVFHLKGGGYTEADA